MYTDGTIELDALFLLACFGLAFLLDGLKSGSGSQSGSVPEGWKPLQEDLEKMIKAFIQRMPNEQR